MPPTVSFAPNRLVTIFLIASTFSIAGCGEAKSPASDTAAHADGASDAATGDANIVATDTLAPDTTSGPTCPGGVGCPCDTPTDCNSPLCLPTPDGKQCSAYCGDGACPEGWACAGSKGGADPTYFCTPKGGLFCRPCNADVECQAAGQTLARCVSYGDLGGYCGVNCNDASDCPPGATCLMVMSTQGGGQSRQCVHPTASGGGFGLCPCSKAAVQDTLSTTCYVDVGEGAQSQRCKGSRACGDAGLSGCVVFKGAAASCTQSQCTDPISGAPVADGKPCDDGRVCTENDTCKGGLCSPGTQTCACEPGFLDCPAPQPGDAANACVGPLYCAKVAAGGAKPFACVPNASQTKVCDDSIDTDCTKNACEPLLGTCAPTPVERTTEICDLPAKSGSVVPSCRREQLPATSPDAAATSCNDGLSCTSTETCHDGICAADPQSQAVTCKCLSDGDCPDDGDLCNGVPFCKKAGPIWQCAVNPATKVNCDTSTDSGCLVTSCIPATGSCLKAAATEGTACDDGVACTVGDVCDKAGSCVPGTWTCCKSDADCASQEDGNLCNGTKFCNKQTGACDDNPSTVVVCPTVDDDACHAASCDPTTGQCAQKPINAGKPCNDGNVCSDGDVCEGGACKPGKDVCICKVDADCAGKDDGDLCNGSLYCNPVAGPDGTGLCKLNPASIVTCPSVDDTACLRNRCVAKTGLCAKTPLKAGTACDADGTACTNGDACDAKGACLVGLTVCECLSDADCAAKEDGNVCNGTLFCDKSGPTPACKLNPATLKSCPTVDDTACSHNACQPKTGACKITPAPTNTPCDDGAPCSVGDHCDGKGACLAGVNTCGCKTDGDCVKFDDGNLCNGAFSCKGGNCLFAAGPKTCAASSNPCQTIACEPTTGDCKTKDLAASTSCSDGDPCTTTDACDGKGACTGSSVNCDDGNACTNDSCVKGSGCNHVGANGPCSDGDVCTGNDVCVESSCKAGAAIDCNDGNTCTNDSCDAKVGCVLAPFTGTVDCFDGPGQAVGICKLGKRTCNAGSGGSCVGQVLPESSDLCDGKDNDCDGVTDPPLPEICDDLDNDCDGLTDQNCFDSDDDGYCKQGVVVVGTPSKCKKGGGDCNDTKYTISPGQPEICDDIDDNCDGQTDEGCDDDGDGFCDYKIAKIGTPKVCPNGGGDCDDSKSSSSPASVEICDDLDNNCNGQNDEGCDDDNDGYCDVKMVIVGKPKTCLDGGGDCNDLVASTSPGKVELPSDGVDNDCDGLTDEAP